MGTPVDIKAIFTRQILEPGSFRVTMEVIDATNIDLDVLVFETENFRFSRVASLYDMETWPAGQELADYNNIAYFRARAGYIEYPDLQDAIHFETITKQRLKILSDLWSQRTDNFQGALVYTASSYIR